MKYILNGSLKSLKSGVCIVPLVCSLYFTPGLQFSLWFCTDRFAQVLLAGEEFVIEVSDIVLILFQEHIC